MKPILVAALVLASITASAAQRAVTDKGDEVILEDNGSWRYLNAQKDRDAANAPTAFNEHRYSKPANASFALKSSRNKAMVYLDPKKWTFSKGKDGADNEYSFRLLSGDLYGRLITERMNIPLETLPQIVLSNMRAAAPDAEIVKQEYRWVNDRKLLHIRMHGTAAGIKVAYIGYYYSDESGTSQFITYTSQNIANTMMREAEDMLNGFSVQP